MCDMPDCFVGFDTSNYTTSAAVTDAQGTVIANLKIPLPVAAGERGLRQSDAVFAHTKNLPLLCEQLREYTKGMRVRAVGVSVTPRDAQDSYMPCFLAGKAAASAYASVLPCELFHFPIRAVIFVPPFMQAAGKLNCCILRFMRFTYPAEPRKSFLLHRRRTVSVWN